LAPEAAGLREQAMSRENVERPIEALEAARMRE
jgi:hypothetical protein